MEPNNFLDNVLTLPRKIDFIHYTPFAGGDFFTSLILLSHNKSKKLIYFNGTSSKPTDNMEIGLDQFETKINSGQIIFKKPLYYNMNYLKPSNRIVQYMGINDIIDLYRFALLNSMFNLTKDSDTGAYLGTNIYIDSLILISGHWIMNPNKMKIFSQYKYWDVITIDPETKYGKKLLFKMNKKVSRISKTVQGRFTDRYPFLENFPFLDYILDQNYNGIKYWIENRYGSDLDFDFIDRSLPMWKKVRVDPYL